MSLDHRLTVSLLASAMIAVGSVALAQGGAAPQSSPSRPAQDGRRTQPDSNLPPSAAAREQDGAAINRDYQVPISQPQADGSPMDSDVQVPIGQTPNKPMPLPPNAGYNNSGGVVDGAALSQQASSGVHYHYHYYGPGAFTTAGTPGYAQARLVNPAAAGGGGGNRFLTAPIGPGNPAPMNTLAGEYQNSENPAVFRGPAPNPELVGGGAGAFGAAGQAWSYGSEVGDWNPYAMGGNGYIDGFND